MSTPALGELLAAARRKRRWTLREVERRTGIHNAHLSQIEKGGIERPAPNLLWTLSALYELDYAKLLSLAGHAQAGSSPRDASRSPAGAALRAMGDLAPEEQRAVLAFIDELKSGGMS